MRKQTLITFHNIARFIQVLELAAIPDLFADGVDDRVHHLHRQPEDDDFRVAKGAVQADGVGEARSFLVGLDPDDVPAMLLNVGKQLPVAVVLGGRQRTCCSGRPLAISPPTSSDAS